MNDPDVDLVRRAGAGDRKAAEALVARHLQRLLGLARRMLNDAAEAEDVAQEVFLRAWREAPRWQAREAKFSTWMHRVALNLCYDRLRRKRERPDPEAGLATPHPGASLHQEWLDRQRAAAVRKAVSGLPERQRAAIALVHFEEMSNIEAAEALELSVEALESLLSRGRRALKAALAGEVQDLLGEADAAPGVYGGEHGSRSV
jgi:RNA polymerase sigma-70 factor (ECF subfamily)